MGRWWLNGHTACESPRKGEGITELAYADMRNTQCTGGVRLVEPGIFFGSQLLISTSNRYMEERGLLLDPRHAGHVNAMALFHKHVANWLQAARVGVGVSVCNLRAYLAVRSPMAMVHI
jgi:hypothetical protein